MGWAYRDYFLLSAMAELVHPLLISAAAAAATYVAVNMAGLGSSLTAEGNSRTLQDGIFIRVVSGMASGTELLCCNSPSAVFRADSLKISLARLLPLAIRQSNRTTCNLH